MCCSRVREMELYMFFSAAMILFAVEAIAPAAANEKIPSLKCQIPELGF